MLETSDITILVEFPDRPGVRQASIWNLSKEELAAKSREALDKAMNLIENMAQRASQLKDRIPDNFTQAEIEFGVKLDYEAGALLAKAGAEGSITVKLTWEREKKPVPTQPPFGI
jgi:hypothetical protein